MRVNKILSVLFPLSSSPVHDLTCDVTHAARRTYVTPLSTQLSQTQTDAAAALSAPHPRLLAFSPSPCVTSAPLGRPGLPPRLSSRRAPPVSDCRNYLPAFACVSLFLPATSELPSLHGPPRPLSYSAGPSSRVPHVRVCLRHRCFLVHLLSRMHLPPKRRLHVRVLCRDILPTFRSDFSPSPAFPGPHLVALTPSRPTSACSRLPM